MAYTTADVAALFEARGVPIATPVEDAYTRLNRIAAALNHGRTVDDVTYWIDRDAAAIAAGTHWSVTPETTDDQAFGYGVKVEHGGLGLDTHLATTTAGLIKNQVPGDPAVWRNSDTNQAYLVYTVPGTDIPLLYTISDSELETVLGPTWDGKVDLVAPTATINSYGALGMGTFAEIYNKTDNPFDAWVTLVERQAAVRPWLRDPEVLAGLAEAMLEGRPYTEAEFQQTQWWRSRSEGERQWALVMEADPRTAEGYIGDNRIVTQRELERMGVDNIPGPLVSFMADQYTTGAWTEAYWQNQMTAVSDPASGIAMDPALNQYLSADMATTQAREEQVRQLAFQWLGPVYGNLSESQVDAWARKFRVSEDAVDEFADHLRSQRLALFPQHENPNLTYEDIAGPWRNFMQNMWGQTPDETDPLFGTLIRNNDQTINAQLLRSEGLNRGVGTVTQDLQTQALRAFGGAVRSPA